MLKNIMTLFYLGIIAIMAAGIYFIPSEYPPLEAAYKVEVKAKMEHMGYAPLTVVLHQCPASPSCEKGDKLWIDGRTAEDKCYSVHVSVKTGMEGKEVKIFPCK